MKLITFSCAAIMAALITSTIVGRPSLAEIEACCKTQTEQSDIEFYVRTEPSGEAAAALARHYANAAGGPSDEAKAMYWFRHAAHKDYPDAIARVGIYTATAAIKPCFDDAAAAEARELLGSPLLQTPQWKGQVQLWLTTLQSAKVSTAACPANASTVSIPGPTLTSPAK